MKKIDDLRIYKEIPVTFKEGDPYPVIILKMKQNDYCFTPKIVEWNSRTNQASCFMTTRNRTSKTLRWITVPGVWISPTGREWSYGDIKQKCEATQVVMEHTYVEPNTLKDGDHI